MTHTATDRTFVPAMGRDWLLPLYDPLTTVLGLGRIRQFLIAGAALESGHRVLDVGCGTGTLAVTIKRQQPHVEVVALDPDPRALAKASRRARRSGVSVAFDRGYSDALPYADASFDRVFSSFMLHHLERREKEETLREIRRVLAPGGRLHLVDFAGSSGAHHRLSDNQEDCVRALMREAGLDAETAGHATLLGGLLRVACYHGTAIAP
jgi:ubiquinone/menaquinone biosynthesis C-methylase UbiE